MSSGVDRARPVDIRRDILGALVVFLAGSALHFAYQWSGQWTPLALFAAVNESVWEHLKIAFWPALGWALAQTFFWRRGGSAYWAARSLGLLTISLTIVATFYGYTAVLGTNVLAIDILTFAVAILFGQVIANLAISIMTALAGLRRLGLALLVAQVIAFASFTFFPPPLKLFEDGRNGLYGISAHDAGPDEPEH